MTLKAQCPGCERWGKALAHCDYCDEWIPLTLALPDEPTEPDDPAEDKSKCRGGSNEAQPAG